MALRSRTFTRIRYAPEGAEDDDLRFLHARYNWVWPVDWDEDGLMDLFYVSMEREEVHHLTMPENADLFQSSNVFTFLKNTGRKDISGMPVLKELKHYSALATTHSAYAPSVAVEDLDGDGKKELIGLRTNVFFYRNTGNDRDGIPNVEEPIKLKTTEGKMVISFHTSHDISFGDVNIDSRIDIIINNPYVRPPQVLWYENKGGLPPVFASKRQIKGIPFERKAYRWVKWKDGEGLLGKDNNILLVRTVENGEPVFTPSGKLREMYAPLVGGSQEKPEWVDWDNDGDMDLFPRLL